MSGSQWRFQGFLPTWSNLWKPMFANMILLWSSTVYSTSFCVVALIAFQVIDFLPILIILYRNKLTYFCNLASNCYRCSNPNQERHLVGSADTDADHGIVWCSWFRFEVTKNCVGKTHTLAKFTGELWTKPVLVLISIGICLGCSQGIFSTAFGTKIDDNSAILLSSHGYSR